jgi:protein TonB
MAKLAGVLTLALTGLAASSFEPAHLERAAGLPGAPAFATGGGEVWLELGVSAGGMVEEVVTLRETPPFTEALRGSVRRWSFAPAREGGGPVASRVLVVGQFRPPTLAGPVIGEAPRDVAAASSEVAVPIESPMPPYPANALGDATVLVEATVGTDGSVSEAQVRGGQEPFATVALDTVQGWRFRAASRAGASAAATVCVVVGFRSPVVGPPPEPRP